MSNPLKYWQDLTYHLLPESDGTVSDETRTHHLSSGNGTHGFAIAPPLVGEIYRQVIKGTPNQDDLFVTSPGTDSVEGGDDGDDVLDPGGRGKSDNEDYLYGGTPETSNSQPTTGDGSDSFLISSYESHTPGG